MGGWGGVVAARVDSPSTDCISRVAADGAVLTVFGPVLFRADTAPGRSPR